MHPVGEWNRLCVVTPCTPVAEVPAPVHVTKIVTLYGVIAGQPVTTAGQLFVTYECQV